MSGVSQHACLQIEILSANLASVTKKYEEFEIKLSQTQDELATQRNLKNSLEQTLMDKVHSLEEQLNDVSLQLDKYELLFTFW